MARQKLHFEKKSALDDYTTETLSHHDEQFHIDIHLAIMNKKLLFQHKPSNCILC